MEKSIVVPAFFPETVEFVDNFKRAFNVIERYNFKWLEIYFSNHRIKEAQDLLESFSYKTIYLGAMAAKTKGLNLSSNSEKLRQYSLKILKSCVDDAYFYNSTRLLINSGKKPKNFKNPNQMRSALDNLVNSLNDILEYIDYKAKDYLLELTLEPGDTSVESFSLIGSTDLAIRLADRINKRFANFSLTLDTSHLLQLGEKPLKSIQKAQKHCSHIHLANCVISNSNHKYYGDKHPDFGVAGGELSQREIIDLFKKIKKIDYIIPRSLIVGIEIICGSNGQENSAEGVIDHNSWFFK